MSSGAESKSATPDTGAAPSDRADGQPSRQELYERALSHLKAGQRELSYEILRELWNSQRSFDVAMAMGGLEVANREYALAAFHFHYARENLPPSFAKVHSDKIEHGFELAWHHVGQIEFDVNPADASIRVDGESVELPLFLEPGEYEVTVSKPGFESYVRQVNVLASRQTRLEVTLQAQSSASPAAASAEPATMVQEQPRWAVLVAGGATTVAFGAIALSSFRRASTKQDQLQDCVVTGCDDGAALTDRRDELHGRGLVWGAAAAGTGVVTTLLWYLWPEQREVPVVPQVSSTGAGITASGRF